LKFYKHKRFLLVLVFCVFLCCFVCVYCTGHFVMVPLNLTCLHYLQHSFFEHLFNLHSPANQKRGLMFCGVIQSFTRPKSMHYHTKKSLIHCLLLSVNGTYVICTLLFSCIVFGDCNWSFSNKAILQLWLSQRLKFIVCNNIQTNSHTENILDYH